MISEKIRGPRVKMTKPIIQGAIKRYGVDFFQLIVCITPSIYKNGPVPHCVAQGLTDALEEFCAFLNCSIKDSFHIYRFTVDGVYKDLFDGKANFFSNFAVVVIE